MNDTQKKLDKIVHNHFQKTMPDDIKRLARLANWDLWNGPLTYCEDCGADDLSDCTCDGPYPGFTEASTTVMEWAKENLPHEVYVDLACDDECAVSLQPPQGEWDGDEYLEPYTDETYLVDWREIRGAVLGQELARHIWG